MTDSSNVPSPPTPGTGHHLRGQTHETQRDSLWRELGEEKRLRLEGDEFAHAQAEALDRLAREIERLRAVMASIQEQAAAELGNVHDGEPSPLWQIEADARAALKEDAR